MGDMSAIGRVNRRRVAATALAASALAATALIATVFAPAEAIAQSAPEGGTGPGGVLGGGAPRLERPDFSAPSETPFALPDADTLTTPQDRPLATGPGFALERIELIGATIAPVRAELDAIVAAAQADRAANDGLWRPADVLALRDQITRAYIAAGYVNSGAQIPPQDVRDGVLEIEVIEGRLLDTPTRLRSPSAFGGFMTEEEFERLEQEGAEPNAPLAFATVRDADDESWRPFQLRRSFVTRRVLGDPAAPLNVADLQERFQILVSNPAIRKIDAALAPGAAPGEARLFLDVVETPPFALAFTAASDRSPSIGGERASLAFSARNALGVGDLFRLEAGVSEGLEDVSVGYDAPLAASDLTLHVYGDYSDAEIIEDPLSDLDVLSETLTFGVGASYPVLRGVWTSVTEDGEPGPSTVYDLTLRGDLARKTSETELGGVGFAFSPGATADGETRLTLASLSLEGLAQASDRVVAARLASTFGLSANDPSPGEANPPPENFVVFLGQAQAAQRVLRDLGHQVIARIDAQYAPDALFSTERFSFGGLDSVRGYRKNEVTADSAVVASLEYRASLSPLGQALDAPALDDWSIGAFIDAGRGWNATLDDPIDDTLLGVGLQLNFVLLDRLTGSVYYGQQLEDVADPVDDQFQDTGFGFRISVRGL